MREGFTENDTLNDTIIEDSTDDVNYDFYIAPAGNTVLYNKNKNKDKNNKRDKENKNCKPKNLNEEDINNNSNNNYKTDPQSIQKSQIPAGDEDLYILKSEIVPPVCPACPNVTVYPNNSNSNSSSSYSNGNGNAPPPCPPCARCPEPAFDCKKVPNYNSNNSEYLPRPVLADFSQFGM
jgi:hypothetical protein